MTQPTLDRLRILFVTPYVPQPLRPRSWRFVRYLARAGHRVTLAVASTDPHAVEHLRELQSAEVEILHSSVGRFRRCLNYPMTSLRGEPMQAGHAWSPYLADAIRERLTKSRYDILHVEHLRAARYALRASDVARHQKTRLVWDAVDCISSLLAGMAESGPSSLWRLAARLELPRTRRFERRLMNHFDLTLVASATDRQSFLTLATPDAIAQGASDRIRVLPNGVQLSTATHAEKPAGQREPVIAFTGVMRYHANEAAAAWLIREIMPKVWSQQPTTRLLVVGADPGSRLQRLARQAGHRVEITGRVPDIRTHLSRAAVAAVPLRYGAGTQFKVLEAWAARTPVVADPRTAAALSAIDGREMVIAATASEFGTAILRLLADSELRDRIGAAGHQRAVDEFGWDRICAALVQAYRELLQ